MWSYNGYIYEADFSRQLIDYLIQPPQKLELTEIGRCETAKIADNR